MNRLLFFALLLLTLCFVSCGNQPSKQFKAMNEELTSIENKINGVTDCDELQMLSFSILGLHTDMDNYRQETEMSDSEMEQIDSLIVHLEAVWHGKWAALDCEQATSFEELDTSGEEAGEFDNSGY